MKELKDYAIVLIYPDGEVEKIPITNYSYHHEYLKDHLKISKKFLEYTRMNIVDWSNHYKISRVLALQGVIEIANKDLVVKIKNAEYYQEFQPEFYFYLPNELRSLEQKNALEILENQISLDKRIYNKYNDSIFDFEKINYSQYEEWKNENQFIERRK